MNSCRRRWSRLVALAPLAAGSLTLAYASGACGGNVTSDAANASGEAGADAKPVSPSGSGGMPLDAPTATATATATTTPPTTSATPPSPNYDASVVTIPCAATGFVDGGAPPACPPSPPAKCFDYQWIIAYAPVSLTCDPSTHACQYAPSAGWCGQYNICLDPYDAGAQCQMVVVK